MNNNVKMPIGTLASDVTCENILIDINIGETEVFAEKRDQDGNLIGFEKAYTSKEKAKKKQLLQYELKELFTELKHQWFNLLLGDNIGFNTTEAARLYYSEKCQEYFKLEEECKEVKDAPVYSELYIEDGARDEIIYFVKELTRRKK